MPASATPPTSNRHAVPFRQVSRITAILLLLCMASAAQQQSQPGTTPDAPSASAQQQQAKADKGPQSGGSGFGVLSKNSWFFPNIATTSAPLTTGQKFQLFARNSVSFSAFLGSAASAGINQALDSPDGYGQGAEGYGKRFGSAMARNASSQFFGTFLLASALHQDPRFFVKEPPQLWGFSKILHQARLHHAQRFRQPGVQLVGPDRSSRIRRLGQ